MNWFKHGRYIQFLALFALTVACGGEEGPVVERRRPSDSLSAATSLTWSETTPYTGTTINANWTKSLGPKLTSEQLQFYTGSACNTPVGSAHDYISGEQTQSYTGVETQIITFKITSQNSRGESVTSSCSSPIRLNQQPVISSNCTSPTFNEDVAYSCTASAVDGDTTLGNDSQTWSTTAAHTCSWVTINATTGAVSGTPTDNNVGSCTVAFRSYDGTEYSTTTLSYALTVTNVAPTLTIADVTIAEDAGSTVIRNDAAVQASDEGYGVYSLSNATTTAPKCSDNGTLSINSTTGAVTFNPTANWNGACNVKVTFDDQNATNNTVSDEFAVTVTAVNDVPVITATCATTGTQDVAYSCAPSATDPDHASRTWSFNATNTCAWASINSTTGAISGTPTDNQVGACTLAFKANDGVGDSLVSSRTVTIANVAPTLTIADASSIPKTAGVRTVRNDAAVQASEEGWGTYSLDNSTGTTPRCSANGVLAINSTTGAVTFDPDGIFTGSCYVKVVFNDGNSSNNTVSDEFIVPVGNNNTPSISATCSTSATENSAYSCTPSHTDADGDTQTWSFTAANDCSWLSINSSTGAISGTPAAANVGTCTLAFKSNDGSSDSNTLSYSITVSAAGPPTLSISDPASMTYASGSTVIRDDAAVQSSHEGSGTYALDNAGATAPKCSANGVLSIDSSTGAVTFDPDNTFSGTCNVKVTFTSGSSVSDEFTVTVNASGGGSGAKPIYAGSTCQTGFQRNVQYSCYMSFNSDLSEGDLIASYALTTSNTCSWASVDATSGQISGTPGPTANSCTLSAQATDMGGDVESHSIALTQGANYFVIANATIAMGSANTIVATDAGVQSRHEGSSTYSSFGGFGGGVCSSNGVVSVDANTGEVSFDPDNLYSGTCTITVFISVAGETDQATFNVTVQ